LKTRKTAHHKQIGPSLGSEGPNRLASFTAH
jgi:hypothetical protein